MAAFWGACLLFFFLNHIGLRGMLWKPRWKLPVLSSFHLQKLIVDKAFPSKTILFFWSLKDAHNLALKMASEVSHLPLTFLEVLCLGTIIKTLTIGCFEQNSGKLGSFKDIDLIDLLILWGCSPTHSFARWTALSAKLRHSHLPDTLGVNPELPGWAFFLSWPWL